MARNIEIKARVSDLAALEERAVAIGARRVGVENQTDRYFEIGAARRFKLRAIDGVRTELIRYARPEHSGVRLSEYEITRVSSEETELSSVLSSKPLVIVRKRRTIYLLDNVRIHLDEVDGLGTFLELEAVVDPNHDEARCRAQIDEIMSGLGIDQTTLLQASYADLLEK